jgi:hypothetical protein
MPRHHTDDKLDEVIKAVSEKLKDAGFARRGPVLRILKDGNCGLIEFQRSQKSLPENLLFTVNTGIVCGSLLDGTTAELEKIRIIDAHIRQRLGMFLPGRPDKWWEVTPQTETESLAAELSEHLLTKAVPYILGLLSTSAIIALWQSGQCPGLTDGQRLRFLSRLTKSAD